MTMTEPVPGAPANDASTADDAVPQDDTIGVLDHGFVRLDASMADDLSVVNAARVSFARRRTEMSDADAGLIRFLMRDRHGTPFEHNSFRFHPMPDICGSRMDETPYFVIQRVQFAVCKSNG